MIGKISIQTRMLLIIVSLIIVPKLILAIVGFLAANSLSPDMPCGMPHTTVNYADHVVRIRPKMVRIWSKFFRR